MQKKESQNVGATIKILFTLQIDFAGRVPSFSPYGARFSAGIATNAEIEPAKFQNASSLLKVLYTPSNAFAWLT